MNANNLVLNRLFTQNVFLDLIDYNNNPTYGTIIRRYIEDAETKNNGELISEIYKYMSKFYRNEYFYQNTLLNKLLLGRHSINTTTALTQISIGKSKADFILINGKAIVYEIKSELDSFDRLETQLNDYFKAFNHVCVVTSENHFDKLSSMLHDTPVGICVLTKYDTVSNSQRKEAIEDNSHLEHRSIFKVLHKIEFENIIKKYFGKLPIAPPVFYFDECFSMFTKIPLFEAYEMALKELKKRNRIVQSEFREVPYELKSLIYFACPSTKRFERLSSFLNKSYGG